MFRKCPYCQSVLVCWNWFHQTQEEMNKFNPNRTYHYDLWGHECWYCSRVHETPIEIRDGISYWLLRLLSNIKLFFRGK